MSAKRNLGRMRHRLTIMTVVRVPDEGGGYARADAVTGTIWARLSTVGALEANTYSQLQERVTHKALIRFRSDVDEGSTVYWLNAGAEEPEVGSTAAPDGLALYVLTAVDADPDGRPGEFMELILRQGGNL
jgi:head-tail adaptor